MCVVLINGALVHLGFHSRLQLPFSCLVESPCARRCAEAWFPLYIRPRRSRFSLRCHRAARPEPRVSFQPPAGGGAAARGDEGGESLGAQRSRDPGTAGEAGRPTQLGLGFVRQRRLKATPKEQVFDLSAECAGLLLKL